MFLLLSKWYLYSLGLSEQQIRISLLSAVKDKLQRRVQEIFYQNQVSTFYVTLMNWIHKWFELAAFYFISSNNLTDYINPIQAELQTLKRTQGDLENGKNNIHNIITKMEEEQVNSCSDVLNIALSLSVCQLFNDLNKSKCTLTFPTNILLITISALFRVKWYSLYAMTCIYIYIDIVLLFVLMHCHVLPQYLYNVYTYVCILLD